MSLNRGYTVNFNIVKGISIAILMVMVAFSGCIEDNDDNKPGHEASPPQEERLIFEIDYVNQSDVNCWDTVVSIYNPTDNEYFLNDVTLDIEDSEGTTLTNAILTYQDLDADNLISNLDIIEISNMTDDYRGSSLSIDYKRKPVGWVSITWNKEGSHGYMVNFYQCNTTKIDDSHWNTYFYIHSIRGENPINISDISIVIQKDANTILTSARVYINDTDGVDTLSRWENEILSESDRIEITSMTEKYRGSAVRMIINDFQVGYGKIGYFNLEGDTEGGIKSNSD